MTIQDIAAFAAVVETGSVVAAASKLHLSQPAVTRRVQNLESSLGEPLLDRSSKPQKPTAAGRVAYGHARGLLASFDNLRHSFGSGDAEGDFRFGATPRMTELGLVDAVARLRKAYPKLALHASSAWSDVLLEQLEAGSIDAAAVSVLPSLKLPEGVETHHLGILTMRVIAAKGERFPKRVPLTELAGRPWILNSAGCTMRGFLADALKARGMAFDIAVEATSVDVQLGLVAKGAGLGLVTDETLAGSPRRSAVQAVNLTDFHPAVELRLAFRPVSNRLRGPLDCLRKSLEASLNRSHGNPGPIS